MSIIGCVTFGWYLNLSEMQQSPENEEEKIIHLSPPILMPPSSSQAHQETAADEVSLPSRLEKRAWLEGCQPEPFGQGFGALEAGPGVGWPQSSQHSLGT